MYNTYIIRASSTIFGLAAFTAEQRTKEIGVRKVLGASVGSIVLLLSKKFARLVLIANVIAWPVAYFAVGDWLQNFVYRVDVAWWVFLLAGVSALLIAFALFFILDSVTEKVTRESWIR